MICCMYAEIIMRKQNFLYPPDFNKCELHRESTRIFKGLESDQSYDECQCCGRRIGRPVSSKICFSDIEFAFLGPGLPLFFTFIKSSIILLLLLTLTFSAYSIATNITSSNCLTSPACNNSLFNLLSFFNKVNQKTLLILQDFMLLIFVVVFILMLHGIRYRMRIVIEKCDTLVDSPSDYAVMVSRMPQNVTHQQLLAIVDQRRANLSEQELRDTSNLEVVQVLLGYRMGQFLDVVNQNKQAFKTSVLEQHQFYPQQLPKLTQPSHIAIIIFQTQLGKDLFLDNPSQFQKLLYCICDPCTPLSQYEIQGQRVAVERAPQPDDIIWQNSNITIKGAISRKIAYNFISIMLLCGGGIAQYGLAVLQTKFTQQDSIVFYIGIASSLAVALMNAIIYHFLVYTANQERKMTQSKTNTNLILKIGLFLFLNAGVFMVGAKILAQMNNLDLESTLATQITQVMILNAITPHFSMIATDYCDIIGAIKRCIIRNDIMFATQMEANLIYERPVPQIADKYGYLIKTLWLTAFYCPLTPIVAPISAVGLLINYVLEKCLHSNSYRAPNMVSKQQNSTALEMLKLIPVILSIGQYLLYLYLYNFQVARIPLINAIPIYISLALSLAQYLVPNQLINKWICKMQSDDSPKKKYQEIEDGLEVTYDMVNPGYQSRKKRKRDKLLLRFLYKQMEELIDITPINPLGGVNELLLTAGAATAQQPSQYNQNEKDFDPLQVILKQQGFLSSFNSNSFY